MTNLNGSEKQINWANEIRANLISKINTAIEFVSVDEWAEGRNPEVVAITREYLPELLDQVNEEDSAKWFIDNGRRGVNYLVEEHFTELFDEMSDEEQNRVDRFWGAPSVD
ncbi:MAG: hypothetical protein AB9917_02265 [Negativicutes bacterium]